MNMVFQMLMSTLQQKSPQGYQFLDQAMRSGGNPQALLQQIVNNNSPEQMQTLLTRAKQYGCPDNILNQVQNMGRNKSK